MTDETGRARREAWTSDPTLLLDQRSNVESTFAMVKRKFGSAVRAKTPIAQQNEVLTKFLAHNLSVLVHGFYDLGIDPDFAAPRVRVADVANRIHTEAASAFQAVRASRTIVASAGARARDRRCSPRARRSSDRQLYDAIERDHGVRIDDRGRILDNRGKPRRVSTYGKTWGPGR